MNMITHIFLLILLAPLAWGLQCDEITKNYRCIRYDNTQKTTVLGVDNVTVMTTQTFHTMHETQLSTIKHVRFHKNNPLPLTINAENLDPWEKSVFLNYKNNYADHDLEWKEEHRFSIGQNGQNIITKHKQIHIILEDNETTVKTRSILQMKLFSNNIHIATLESSNAELHYEKKQKRTAMKIPL